LREQIPDPHPPELAHQADGFQVGATLSPGTEDGQITGIRISQEISGDATDRAGPDGGDHRGIDYGTQTAVAGFIDQDCSLMRVELSAVVPGEDGDDLNPRNVSEAGGHHGHDVSAGDRHDSAQRLDHAALTDLTEGLLHNLEAFPHSQESC